MKHSYSGTCNYTSGPLQETQTQRNCNGCRMLRPSCCYRKENMTAPHLLPEGPSPAIPAKLRIRFKIILTVHTSLLGNVPTYLINKLKHLYIPWRFLSPEERDLLADPSALVDLNYGMNYRPISEISNQLQSSK